MKQSEIVGKLLKGATWFFTILLIIGVLMVGGCAKKEIEERRVDQELEEVFDFVGDSESNQEDESQELDKSEESQVINETQRIGKEHYGYVSIPAHWIKFIDVNGAENIFQYSDITGRSIVTLNAWGTSDMELSDRDAESFAKRMWYGIEAEGAQDIKGGMTEIYGHTAYQIYGIYPEDGILLAIWIFDGEDGYLHYIAAEAPLDQIEELVAIVERTYSFIE